MAYWATLIKYKTNRPFQCRRYAFMVLLNPYQSRCSCYTKASDFFLLLHLWSFVLESPRWLLSRGRKDDAVAVLRKIEKFNNVKLPEGALDNLTAVEEHEEGSRATKIERVTFLHVFKKPRLLVNSLVMFYAWWVNIHSFWKWPYFKISSFRLLYIFIFLFTALSILLSLLYFCLGIWMKPSSWYART